MTRQTAAIVLAVATLFACSSDPEVTEEVPFLLPIEDQAGRVNQSLRVPLAVSNPDGLALTYTYEAPPLPALNQSVTIGGTPAGGEFVWTPLASHAGSHTFVFTVTSERGAASETIQIDIEAVASAAPVFIRPGPGGTYNLSDDPCVGFEVEVRDDDSESVEISFAQSPPDGASLTAGGPKTAAFSWCPTPDQVDASSRWDIFLQADDGEQEPATLRYVIVLRAPVREGCPGEAPMVTVISPAEGATVESDIGYEVVATISDDAGLRDAPILYYSQEEPDDRDNPNLEDFKQAFMERADANWAARVPTLGLEPGETTEVFVFVSATDNDDAQGTACDHTTDSELVAFTAAGGGEETFLELCELCTESGACGDNVCATTSGGARCAPTCVTDDDCGEGSCLEGTLVDGSTVLRCGPVDVECGAGGGGVRGRRPRRQRLVRRSGERGVPRVGDDLPRRC